MWSTSSGNFKSFFVVEFADSESVEAVLRLAQHQESDGSSTPVCDLIISYDLIFFYFG